jgi:hypothetical protein
MLHICKTGNLISTLILIVVPSPVGALYMAVGIGHLSALTIF